MAIIINNEIKRKGEKSKIHFCLLKPPIVVETQHRDAVREIYQRHNRTLQLYHLRAEVKILDNKGNVLDEKKAVIIYNKRMYKDAILAILQANDKDEFLDDDLTYQIYDSMNESLKNIFSHGSLSQLDIRFWNEVIRFNCAFQIVQKPFDFQNSRFKIPFISYLHRDKNGKTQSKNQFRFLDIV